MHSSDKFTLYVYDTDYGLPSVNPECTKILLYCSIAKIPSVQIKIINNLKLCTLYSGPHFIHKNVACKNFNDTVLYLKTLNYSLDGSLTGKQKSECLAWSNLVSSKLKPIVEFAFWLDFNNFEEFTRVWYSKALPFPFNNLITKRLKEDAVNLFDSLYPADYSIELIRENLQSTATECLSSLSTRLGTSNYFFGDSPTTLDVLVYSYVAPLIKLPFTNGNFKHLVLLWPNIVNFIKRIDTTYLPDLPKETKYIKDATRNNKTNNDDEISYVAISILTISAVTLVVGFAISRGFITRNKFF